MADQSKYAYYLKYLDVGEIALSFTDWQEDESAKEENFSDDRYNED
jgi:hypothetical protein